jgi:hypothetical protein
MNSHRCFKSLILAIMLIGIAVTVRAAEPSFDQTARYLLELVKAFRTAYVLQVVEHARPSGIQPNEDWEKASHLVPLPAQFVKGAAEQVSGFELGLIGLTPLNSANRPQSQAEMEALLKLVSNRDLSVLTFVDGDQFKAISSDLAIVQSCVDCHNHHPRATRQNFQRWDVMGGIVVRLKRDVTPEGFTLDRDAPKRPYGPLERLTPNPTAPLPWVR